LDIGIGSLLTAAALTAPLAELLAGCTVSVIDKHEKVPDGVDVLIVRTTNASEFPTGIAVYVWDRGVAFLADDSGTTFGDGSGGPVRIVRPLPPDLFASRPDLVSAVARNSGQRGTDGRDLIR
jgi:hypothetical protein